MYLDQCFYVLLFDDKQTLISVLPTECHVDVHFESLEIRLMHRRGFS